MAKAVEGENVGDLPAKPADRATNRSTRAISKTAPDALRSHALG